VVAAIEPTKIKCISKVTLSCVYTACALQVNLYICSHEQIKDIKINQLKPKSTFKGHMHDKNKIIIKMKNK
jgi:hypothetical protein